MGMALTVPLYTVEDLEHFPDDGNRYELLDGVLLVTPSPGVAHQGIATRLAMMLGQQLGLAGPAHVFAPGVVIRPPRTQLEPDVLVVPARFSLKCEWVDITEHWLAVEVISRSSRMYDREFKRDAYFDLNVQQVWLVDTEDESVEVCRRRGPGSIERDAIAWHVPTIDLSVTIDLRVLFSGLQ